MFNKRKARWGDAEILYFPYYAYEEVLAPLADPPLQKVSLLNSMERLTARLTGNKVAAMPSLPSGQRERLLALYQPARATQQSYSRQFFLSFASADKSERIVRKIAAAIDRRFGTRSAFWFETIPLGAKVRESLDSGLTAASALIVVVGSNWRKAKGSLAEVNSALAQGKPVIPLLLEGSDTVGLPPSLKTRRVARLAKRTFDDDVQRFVEQLGDSVSSSSTPPEDFDDPQKGKFGGLSERNGRRINASVSGLENDWFNINLRLETTGDVPLKGPVEFYLHPTFRPDLVRVPSRRGRASLNVRAWGPFTVGAVADEGLTRVELDLAQLIDAPITFLRR
jgi:hypothetical protein